MALGKPDMLRLLEFVEGFSERFSHVFNTASAWQREAFGGYTTAQILDHLEISPDRRLTTERGVLLRSYGVFRARRPYGEGATDEIARRVGQKHGEASAELLEAMQHARLGAWQITEASDGFEATRIDGTDAPFRRELDVFTDYQWAAITAPGVYVGWLIEQDETCMLFFAAELDAAAVDFLNRVAQRAPWGWPDGDADNAFRRVHYEEDILSLLVRADCINTGRDDMRVILSREIRQVWYLRQANLFDDVEKTLHKYGLRSGVYVEDTGVFGEYGAVHPDHYQCHICNDFHRKNAHLAPGWSVDVALLVEDHVEAIVSQLEAMRLYALPKSTTWHYSIPVGPHSLEYVFPIAEMLAMIALDPSGRIEHPRLGHAEEYPLSSLDIDLDAFRNAGFDLNWSIGQAKSWAERHAAEELQGALEEAVERYHAAFRWACLVDRHRQMDPNQTIGIGYEELFWGIRKLFPTAVLETPLAALRDRHNGTWRRIEKATREDKAFDTPVLRLGHLPPCMHTLGSLSGIGSKTLMALVDGLVEYVANWPDSAGYASNATSPEMQEAASAELSSGLDALDDLF
ncbi:hypothetical protein FIV42_13470 [Persicimonas caeni]|uniref:Uncharacterized protein n=1 Tax=Persicimonas caeni TaxID=2292766 RepID=A0A4Y6PUC9_PERCE|nr:hypothetical protein [Persicimonas caeni]QDG51719.1 hypothetical protein FIV42_13470 [Persicimonas caeni]QED32940.1 hypothetical protein FRD00_13465 [Persicimonas caeni]